jgi:hypothetical protein
MFESIKIIAITVMYITEQQQQNVQVRLCFLFVGADADRFRT